ncbi:uncharacterized protein PF3D7_1120000-like [Centruroides vittatus]|uniref:uncharacterized protein PF3D7_1120000-like n=1 Tax=Centruroides vittatus TaxID=120091 RepID=UPI00350FA894
MAGVLENVGKLAKSLETFIHLEDNDSSDKEQNEDLSPAKDHHFSFTASIKSKNPSSENAIQESLFSNEFNVRIEDISSKVIHDLAEILNKYKNKIILGDCESGLGGKLYGDCLQEYSDECNKCLQEAIQIIKEEVEKQKKKAVEESLKTMNAENEQYIKEMQMKFQKQLQDEIAKVKARVQQEIENEVEEEKRISEEKIKESVKDVTEQFKTQLKEAVSEAQEHEMKMGQNKCKQMRSGFDEKLREIKRIAEEEKDKCLAVLKENLIQEKEEAIKNLKKEEEQRANVQMKRQQEYFENVIENLQNKLKELEREVRQLNEQLKEANVQKSEANMQLSNLKLQLQQFIVLANKTEMENPRIKIGRL